MNYELHHGDCLDVLPTLAPQSVDCVCADIPSGRTACAWDSVIPFEPMWAGIRRVLKPRGACVLLGCTQPFTSALVMSNPKMFRWEDIWEKSKPVGFLNAEDRPMRAHENILVFCDGKPTYNPQKYRIDPIFMDRRKTFTVLADATAVYGNRKPKAKRKDDGTRYPISIIPISSAWRAGMHTTQKPLALLEYLVKTYTNEGDTVLDFTFGSCTTGVACLTTGRKFIGIEKDLTYFTLGSERIDRAYQAPRGFLDLLEVPHENGKSDIALQGSLGHGFDYSDTE